MSTTKDNIYTSERLYLLSDDIDNASIGQLTWSILHQIKNDDEKDEKEKDYERKPIKLYINSYGGSIYDMWGLIDVIQNSKTPIYTYCTGYAMSAAFKIFLAGHKRYCYKHSTFLVHQLSGWNCGKYLDLKNEISEYDRLNNDIEKYILSRTKFTEDKIEEIWNKKQDFYFNADDAVKYGVVDEIL